MLGAICVTDRTDDRPFTAADVTTLRKFAAGAALALERERALDSAEAHAHAAAIDPVSGVFNRRYLQVRLGEELQRSRRHDIPLALLLIDIDDFKIVNDSYGHLAGDLVLRDVAEILRRSVRVFDVCARFGGEEFVIIMPGSTAESAMRIAERIRERIESYHPGRPASVEHSHNGQRGVDGVRCGHHGQSTAGAGGQRAVRREARGEEPDSFSRPQRSI